MIAAMLWALDGLLRSQLTASIPSTAIVFYEHLVGFVLLLPFFWRALPKVKTLHRADWFRLILLTIVSSVLGTILFTEAFARSAVSYDFITPTLLQKLQPVFVVLLSAILLRERVTWRFIGLAILALVGSYMVTFGSESVSLSWSGKEIVFLLSIGAALAWGSGTILSKKILEKLSFSEATSLRFLLAIPISAIAMLTLNHGYSPVEISGASWLRFVAIGLTTGAAAILIYYRGLRITPAKVSTFAELMFPVTSILIAVTALNPFGAPQPISFGQGLGILILIVSILLIGTSELPAPKVKESEAYEGATQSEPVSTT